jgi:hypothetical protein
MECNQAQGFTACGMKLEATKEHAAKFITPKFHLFNIHLTRTNEETGEGNTLVVNRYPLTFTEATKWVRGMLTGSGQDIIGFRGVVDCWMEPTPLCKVDFKTEGERHDWLIQHVRDQIKRLQDRETQALLMENEQLRQEIALNFQGQIGGML